MKKIIFFLALCLVGKTLAVAGLATVQESIQSILTYPYSDPTPVAQLCPQRGRPSYPYNKFEGYTSHGEQQNWKVVTLENDYIQVTMFPEMGGKVWGAIEKSTGKEFLYQNHVNKFRDIAMRGAWTSGGLEFNFGILGHVPSTATPVDYYTEQKKDGSVSCYVANYEQVTGVWWMVEVNLRPDRAYFTTSVTWYNSSLQYQSCYQWMNAAYSVRGEAEFIYPGNACIDHDGKWDTYPVNKEGKPINWYKDVNFGSDVSVHVLGHFNDFYGIYWHDWNFGSGHQARHADKLGAKYFIWSKARSGAIWENLLTDSDGQYIEMQSGRMFCQPNPACATTPFQHTALQPGATETWTEYWYPIVGTLGVKQSSSMGTLNVLREDGKLRLLFSPLRKLHTKVHVYQDDNLVATLPLHLNVLQLWDHTLDSAIVIPQQGHLRVVVGEEELVYSEHPQDVETNRPLESPKDFDWQSAYGHSIKGENWYNQKRYVDAEKELLAAIEKEPYFLPALTDLAKVYNCQGRYEEAFNMAHRGLAVSTYDADCNYQYALASMALGKSIFAKDGFSMASRDVALRSAAHLQLAQIYAQGKNIKVAQEYVQKAVKASPSNLDAKVMSAYLQRSTGHADKVTEKIATLLRQVPLYQPARFEAYRLNLLDKQQFLTGVQNEYKAETLLQIALLYQSMGALDDALLALEMLAENPILAYHKAYILHLQGKEDVAKTTLQQAQALSPEFVFPYRPASYAVLEWAEQTLPAWQNRYYMALVAFGTQQMDKALQLLLTCDQSNYAPLFLTRASLQNDEAQLQSLLHSEKLNKSWRVGLELIKFYVEHQCYTEAVNCGKTYLKRYPENYYLGVQYALALCKAERYKTCIDFMATLRVLPYEGYREGHDIYRDAYLGYAQELMRKGHYKAALDAVAKAREWPESLGVGKPYDNRIDSSREDALEAEIKSKL